MNNPQSFDAGNRARRSDPVLVMTAAVRDLWMLGATALEGMLAQGKDDNGSPAAYFERLLPAVSALRALVEANVGAWSGGGPSNIAEQWLGVFSLATRAQFAAGTIGLRYWNKFAQIHAAHSANITRTLSAGGFDPTRSDKERRVLIDEMRAYLREVGDLALQEARAFQFELEKLAAETAAAATAADGTPEYKRRWKMKQ